MKVFIEYAQSVAAKDSATQSAKQAEVAAFLAFPEFVSGKQFISAQQELRAMDESLVRLLVPNPTAATRNKCVGIIMGRTSADDVSRVKGIVNKYAGLKVGVPAIVEAANKFSGTLDEFEQSLAAMVEADDELAALQSRIDTYKRQIRKAEARMAEIKAGQVAVVL